MRNILLLVSHLFSGSSDLMTSLNDNERIDLTDHLLSYEHPSMLEYLFNVGHKLDNAAAIYGSQVLHNKDFSCKAFYNFVKFIYVVRPAKPTLNEIKLHRKEYSDLTASRYYCFRLRRMYEMAHSTPGAIFLTYDDIYSEKGLKLIQEYLDLPTALKVPLPTIISKEEVDIPFDIVTKSQDCYEKYLYSFKQLNLRFV